MTFWVRLGYQWRIYEIKKFLDVGVGGGRALDRANKLGLAYYAVDILPAYNVKKEPSYSYEEKRQRVKRKVGFPFRLGPRGRRIGINLGYI